MFPRRIVLDFEGRRLQGARPFAVFSTKNGVWKWQTRGEIGAKFPFRDGAGNPLVEIQKALHWCRDEGFENGAAAGFLAYDLARQIEPRAFANSENCVSANEIPPKNSHVDDLEIPDARLVFYENWQSEAEIADETQVSSTRTSQNETSEIAPPEYENAIAQILEFIARGDIYQANFTQRFARELPCSPAELYTKLRAQNPAPFGAFLSWDDFSLVSNSPERFLKLTNRVLEAQPIKGTIHRGHDQNEDEILQTQLQNSPKDRAENVMIVDLLRNDLGRVCEFGSVHVPSLFAIQTLPILHHLVSTVRGVLRENHDSIDAIRACFPCGSITGAPKIRAMQILDELETVRRGAAMGAIGYFGFDGNMDWNVAIRTVTCVRNRAYFHVGGGIVSDSKSHSEYAEMRLKARAIETALQTKKAEAQTTF